MTVKDIDDYGQINADIKTLTGILTDGKNILKQRFRKTDQSEFEGDRYVANIQKRLTTKFDEKKVLKIVKENGLDWLLMEVVDLKKLEDAIVGGEIPVELFSDCVSEVETLAVTFKERV